MLARLDVDVPLRWLCDTCGDAVDDGHGLLHCPSVPSLAHAEVSLDGTTPFAPTLVGGIWDYVDEPVRWRVYHYECAPVDSVYEIAVERIRTVSHVFFWTGHLSEKNWVAQTNWYAMFSDRLGKLP